MENNHRPDSPRVWLQSQPAPARSDRNFAIFSRLSVLILAGRLRDRESFSTFRLGALASRGPLAQDVLQMRLVGTEPHMGLDRYLVKIKRTCMYPRMRSSRTKLPVHHAVYVRSAELWLRLGEPSKRISDCKKRPTPT